MAKERIVKTITAIIAIAGLLLMLGSVGALETDSVTFTKGAIQLVIGLTAFIGGTLVTIGA